MKSNIGLSGTSKTGDYKNTNTRDNSDKVCEFKPKLFGPDA